MKNYKNRTARLKENVGLVSFMPLQGKSLKIKDTKTVEMSTPKTYCIIEHDGKVYEINADYLHIYQNMEFKRTNSKEYWAIMDSYLLDAFNADYFELGDKELSDKEKINLLFEDFNRVMNHDYNLRKFPNERNRLADHLQGLPSSIDIAFMNVDILEKTKEFHDIDFIKSSMEDRVLKNWWEHIAQQLIRLRDQLNK